MLKKNNKNLLIGASVAVGAALASGVYFLYKLINKPVKITNNKIHEVTKILGEKLNEYSELKKSNPSEKMPLEILSLFNHLISECDEYFFTQDFHEIEAERLEFLNNREAYLELVRETLETKEKTFAKTMKYLSQNIKYDLNEVQEVSQQVMMEDKDKFKDALDTYRIRHDITDLPLVEKDILKKAYIFYAKSCVQNEQVNKTNFAMSKMKPEYQEIAMETFFLNKFRVKDNLKKNFNIEERFLSELLVLHNLNDDEDIILAKAELSKCEA